MSKCVLIDVGCLECECWTYIVDTYSTVEEGLAKLKELAGGFSLYTSTGNEGFDAKATCIAYERYNTNHILELHRLDGQKGG